MVLCFVSISVTSMLKDGVYTHLFVANTKFQGINSYLRENFPLKKSSSLLLLVNYMTATSAIVYLFLRSIGVETNAQSIGILLIPMNLGRVEFIMYADVGMVNWGESCVPRSDFFKNRWSPIVRVRFVLLCANWGPKWKYR